LIAVVIVLIPEWRADIKEDVLKEFVRELIEHCEGRRMGKEDEKESEKADVSGRIDHLTGRHCAK